MSIFDKLRTQKFLSFTLVLFTLSDRNRDRHPD